MAEQSSVTSSPRGTVWSCDGFTKLGLAVEIGDQQMLCTKKKEVREKKLTVEDNVHILSIGFVFA